MYNERVPLGPTEDYHIIILHEELLNRRIDEYIINIAFACLKLGYKVTILTSHYDKEDSVNGIKFLDKLSIKYSGWWIPKSFGGYFKSTFSSLKAVCMACNLICSLPRSRPRLVLLDVDLVALKFLNRFTNYKIYCIEHFMELRDRDGFYNKKFTRPIEQMQLADGIIVESIGLAEIIKNFCPFITIKPTVLHPSVDMFSWTERAIDVHQILPDLPADHIMFLTLGKFKKDTNFKLSLRSFHRFLKLMDSTYYSSTCHLVLAGTCESMLEFRYFNELLEYTRDRPYANNVSFLRLIPTALEKSLIMKSEIIIIPEVKKVSSDFLLKAMSLSKPIVATTSGTASQILKHRISGLTIEPKPKLFALAMMKLLVNPYLKTFLGDSAKESFEKSYSFKSLCKHINDIIDPSSSISKSKK